MDKLTLVIPTYNLGNYLDDTLASVAGQTIPLELWLIDDASTDGTAEKVTAYAATHPNAHVQVFTTHQGVGVARNFGIDHATGEAIAFVDGDDRIAPDFAATLLKGFTPGVVATAVGYNWWSRSTGGPDRFETITQADAFDQVSRHGSALGGYVWNKAFATSALTQNHVRFDEQLPIAEDYLFVSSFVAHTPGLYAWNPAIRYTKVNRPNSTIHQFSWSDRRREDQVFRDIAKMRRLIRE